jgi:hypothetical protein
MKSGYEDEYTQGRIGVRNVAIACFPAGLTGNGPAAVFANKPALERREIRLSLIS